jgi:LuxR family transcriptional regulator, maltose regulon positive regulatory protein
LCDAVTGRTDSQALLERVERANLFLVPLDEVRGWWRYHHLFADLLRVRLAAERPERAAELHHAAATWCQEHNLADDAIGHALAAGDPEWAARLVERHLDQTLRRGEGVMLQRRLATLPAEVVRSRPGLVLAQAMLEVHRGRMDEAERLLEHVDRAVDRRLEPEQPRVPTDGGMVSRVPAAIALLRAELAAASGDPEQSARFARSAMAHLSEEEVGPRLWARWLLPLADWMAGRAEQAEPALAELLAEGRATAGHHPLVSNCSTLARVQRARGRLGAALRTYQEGLQFATEGGRPSIFHAAEAHVGIGQVLYERNQLDEARRHLTEGLALCRPVANPQLSALGLMTMAWLRQATGDPAGARQVMDEACAQLVPDTPTATLFYPAPAERVRLLLAQGDLDEAARWVEERGLGAQDEPSYLWERDHLVLARVLLAQGDADRALGLLQRLATLAECQRRTDSLIRIRIVRARGLQAAGDHDAALAELADALALAAPEGYVRVFLDEGAPMAALLDGLAATTGKGVPAAGVPPAYLGRLLRALQQAGVPVGRHGRRAAGLVPGLLEPLSERELEVLGLLAAGRSNQAIAEELVITLDTVKRHVSHLLDKLGAANRTQAVARARELGLLR